MLICKCTFNTKTLRELINMIEAWNYFLPTYLSKEAVFFLNAMLQYNSKRRLSAEQLYYHKFWTKPYSELTKIDLSKATKNIVASQIKINS